jgi:hypothetical protein
VAEIYQVDVSDACYLSFLQTDDCNMPMSMTNTINHCQNIPVAGVSLSTKYGMFVWDSDRSN